MQSLRAFTILCCAVLIFGVAACSGGDDNASDVSPDGSSDVATDAPLDMVTPDPGPDLGPDVAPDTNPDVAPDVTPDTLPDMTEDFPVDVVPDATPDAAPDAEPTDTPTETVELPENLACVGSIVWPEPVEATYTHTYELIELLSQEPVVGATAKVCATQDALCVTPLSTGTTDAYGNVTLTFAAAADGLDGYVEFSGADIVTTLGFYRYTDNALAYTSPGAFVYFVLGTNTLVALAGLSSVEPDVTRGHVIFSAGDCDGEPVAGVFAEIMSADAGTTTVYTEGGLPNTDLTATSADGQGGILNVPPGTSMLSGFHQATGAEIGSTEIVVRAGAVTSTIVVPVPLWE